MRRLIVASALLATLLFGPLGLVFAAQPVRAAPLGAQPVPATNPAAPVTDYERATAAIDFMLSLQRADGSIDGSIGETADWIIGTADFGINPRLLKTCAGVRASQWLLQAASGSSVDAGKLAKAILAFYVDGNSEPGLADAHLDTKLAALYNGSTGAYGDGATFTQALSVLAAGSARPAKAVEYLAALQGTDGSFNFKAAADATAGDTNSTAIALIALAAAGNDSANTKALAWLHTQQLGDGGFPYQNLDTYGPPASDPDSDSLVIQALVATGQDPTAAEWSKGTANALTHLRSTQAASGGFVFPGASKADALTTSQALAGLAQKPYGTPPNIIHSWIPRSDCPQPPDVATATPATNVTPPPTESQPGAGNGAPPIVPILVLVGSAGLIALPLRRVARRLGR